jgi:hypothetical protein
MAHEEQGDQMGADHLMRRGDGTCPHHLPLPRGQFNPGLPRDASYYCKTCVRGPACDDAERGGPVVDLADLMMPDDVFINNDDDDEEARAQLPKPWGWDGD